MLLPWATGKRMLQKLLHRAIIEKLIGIFTPLFCKKRVGVQGAAHFPKRAFGPSGDPFFDLNARAK